MNKVIDADITFFSEGNGGKSSLPQCGYRPHVVIKGNEEYLGIQFVSIPDDIQFDRASICSMGLLYYPDVDYSSLGPGVQFELREGPHSVAEGKIVGGIYDVKNI